SRLQCRSLPCATGRRRALWNVAGSAYIHRVFSEGRKVSGSAPCRTGSARTRRHAELVVRCARQAGTDVGTRDYRPTRASSDRDLLLSNDFLRSSYCMGRELPRVLGRNARGECEIIPIVVRACRYDKLALGTIQVVLPGGKSIDEYDKRDRAWEHVTR